MINDIIRNIFRFFILIAVQVFLIKNIELGRFINPFLYILFVLMLPFETPNWLVLILSFILGLTVDMFYDTMGMHAAASAFMGFCRPAILKLLAPRDGYENGTQPSLQYFGIAWFLSYAGILIFLHHIVLFFIEIFRLSEFFSTFFRVILSTLCSLLLILITQFLFYKNKSSQ